MIKTVEGKNFKVVDGKIVLNGVAVRQERQVFRRDLQRRAAGGLRQIETAVDPVVDEVTSEDHRLEEKCRQEENY